MVGEDKFLIGAFLPIKPHQYTYIPLSCSLIPALAILCCLGATSAYTFSIYGRLIHVHQSESLGQLWKKEIGPDSSWVISLATLTFCFGAALSYSILLGDVFSALARVAGITGIAASRSFWIVLLTSTTLCPLCNLKSLLALAPLSVIGVVSIAITLCFLGIRCPSLNALSPYTLTGGTFPKTLVPDQIPQFDTYSKGVISPASTILIGMASSAYLGHFSAPTFYYSLTEDNERKPSSNALNDYLQLTTISFSIATVINCLATTFGFLTFGGTSSGIILNNYSVQDAGASLCRLLMAVCVIGGYPFLVSACRKEFLQICSRNVLHQNVSSKTEKKVTNGILALLTCAALMTKDAGLVIGFTGAVMGSFIVYIFPAALFLSNMQRPSYEYSVWQRSERWFCWLLIGFGAIVGYMGVSLPLR